MPNPFKDSDHQPNSDKWHQHIAYATKADLIEMELRLTILIKQGHNQELVNLTEQLKLSASALKDAVDKQPPLK